MDAPPPRYKFAAPTPSPPSLPLPSLHCPMAPSVRDVLAFHAIDRAAYERLRELGAPQQLARNALALLMWVEQSNHEVVRRLAYLSPAVVRQVAVEADAALRCLRRDDAVPDMPLITSMCRDQIDPRFFAFNQDLIVRGVAHILDGVGELVFDDQLCSLLRRYEAGLLGGKMPPDLALPYVPRPVPVPEDCRSMFVTFSRGLPIDRDEIFDYFNQKWGECVVRVLMEKTTAGVTPMYGRIIFKSEAFVNLVLNGERLVKLVINQRQLWVRKYVPRNNSTV